MSRFLVEIIRSLRPKQWIKNLFIVAPVVFSRELGNLYVDIKILAGFVLFCTMAGCVYLINDIADAEQDRLHPEKRHRPLPSGRISRTEAVAAAAVICCLSVFFSFWLHPFFGVIVSSYFIMNLLYSFWLKHMVILDVLIIAVGFVLRVEAGSVIIQIPPSPWIIMSTLLLALFLGFAKRRGEILSEGNFYGGPEAGRASIGDSRAVLNHYSPELLDNFLLITATAAVMSYAIYTASDYVYAKFGTHNLIYTTVFVIYGLFRYYYLIHQKNLGSNPSEVLYSDYPMVVNLVLWLTACVLIIGL